MQDIIRMMMNRAKIVVLTFAVLAVLEADARADSWDVGIGSGIGILAGSHDKLGDEVDLQLRLTLSVGYCFSRYKLSLEGQIGFYNLFGSVVSSVSIFQGKVVDVYAVLGVGVGWTIFFNRRLEYGPQNEFADWENSGMLQIQAGGGVRFHILEWLDLATETRLRVGIPDNPDVVTLIQHVWVAFKL